MIADRKVCAHKYNAEWKCCVVVGHPSRCLIAFRDSCLFVSINKDGIKMVALRSVLRRVAYVAGHYHYDLVSGIADVVRNLPDCA